MKGYRMVRRVHRELMVDLVRRRHLRQAGPNEDLTGKTMILVPRPQWESQCECGYVPGLRASETDGAACVRISGSVILTRELHCHCGKKMNPEGWWVVSDEFAVPYTCLFHVDEEEQ